MSLWTAGTRTRLEDTVFEAETALTDPAVRQSRARIEALLHPDFSEIGSSGEVYDRDTMIEMMATESPGGGVVLRDFTVHPLSEDTVLATYRSIGTSGKEARRSSIWVNNGHGWQIRHHQGTRVPDRWGHVG